MEGIIRIVKTQGWDRYCMGRSEICINFEINTTDEAALSTIIHEIRHWQQDTIFGVVLNIDEYDDATDETYHNSPVEIDARYFQKVETEIRDIYRSLMTLVGKNDKHNFSNMYRRVG